MVLALRIYCGLWRPSCEQSGSMTPEQVDLIRKSFDAMRSMRCVAHLFAAAPDLGARAERGDLIAPSSGRAARALTLMINQSHDIGRKVGRVGNDRR